MAIVQYSSEEALLNALKEGNNEALKHIYTTHWPMIARFVKLNSGTAADAEELFQEGVIALYEQVRKENFTLTCSPKTYLYSICRNKWLHELRGRKVVLDIEEYTGVVLEDSEEEAVNLPLDEDIKKAILSLGDPCQQLLLGFYYHRQSMEMLAEKLQYSSANVAKQQKFRCLERLKKMFLPSTVKYAND